MAKCAYSSKFNCVYTPELRIRRRRTVLPCCGRPARCLSNDSDSDDNDDAHSAVLNEEGALISLIKRASESGRETCLGSINSKMNFVVQSSYSSVSFRETKVNTPIRAIAPRTLKVLLPLRADLICALRSGNGAAALQSTPSWHSPSRAQVLCSRAGTCTVLRTGDIIIRASARNSRTGRV